MFLFQKEKFLLNVDQITLAEERERGETSENQMSLNLLDLRKQHSSRKQRKAALKRKLLISLESKVRSLHDINTSLKSNLKMNILMKKMI
jgi:hypothetical protein